MTAFLDDFQTTLSAGIDGDDMAVSLAVAVPVAARGQSLLLRIEDADGDGAPSGANVEHLIVTVPSTGASPLTVTSRPVDNTVAVPHAAESVVTAVVTSDMLRERFGGMWEDQLRLYGMRSWTFQPQTSFGTVSPGDEVDADGRAIFQVQRLLPSDNPLTAAVTYIHTSPTAGLTSARMYAIDAETYRVLGRTADLVATGAWATTQRKEHALTADAGASLVIPKDRKWIILAFRFVGTAVPQFAAVNVPAGQIWSSMNIQAETGWAQMDAEPAANAVVSNVWNASYNASIWGGFK